MLFSAGLGFVFGDDGVYLADANEVVTVAHKGQALAGSTITEVSVIKGPDRGGVSSVNERGEVAFKASLADGREGVFRFVPTAMPRLTGSRDWNDGATWRLGLAPSAATPVDFAPSQPTVLTGPSTPATIKSLSIGGGAAAAELVLRSMLEVTEGVTVLSGGVLSGSGSVVATTTNDGVVSPGESAGLNEIEGDFVQGFGGELAIELLGEAGVPGADSDQLRVTGTAALDGGLRVVLGPAVVISGGESFRVLTAAGGVSGRFDPERSQFDPLPGNLLWEVEYRQSEVVVSILAGDYNGDGLVATDDLSAWAAGYGQPVGAFEGADGNGDGFVDAADYTLLRDALARFAPVVTIPEPSGALLSGWLAVGLGLGVQPSRRR